MPHHPSRWSPQILETIAPIIREWGLPVHDPFAGTGERLGELCDTLGLLFTGTEIEPEFIIDPRVKPGNSCDSDTYPDDYGGCSYCVVTSPVYPNGMTDHFKPKDNSRRITYRQALAAILGRDRPLHEDNMGRYGPRRGVIAEMTHWAIARECAVWWPNRVIVNISDCVIQREIYVATSYWINILNIFGYATQVIAVTTPRMRFGANRDARVDTESVIVGVIG